MRRMSPLRARGKVGWVGRVAAEAILGAAISGHSTGGGELSGIVKGDILRERGWFTSVRYAWHGMNRCSPLDTQQIAEQSRRSHSAGCKRHACINTHVAEGPATPRKYPPIVDSSALLASFAIR